MASFNFKDAVLTLQPGLVQAVGPVVTIIPAGAPFRIYSATKVTADPGGKANYQKGFAVNPLAVLIATAEGKCTIECSNASEVWDARQAMGGVYSNMIVTLTLARTFITPTTFAFNPAVWTNGGLFDGSDATGFTDKIEVMFTDCKQDLVSIYNKAA